MSLEQIEKQIEHVQKSLKTPSDMRILQRLLQKHMAAKRKGNYFIAPDRERVEYLHYLYAILDDTDLLSKVSPRDVDCVASLINRLKSLTTGQEVEILHFDEIARDSKFAKKAASKILQNEDMYSLYSKIYLAKEETVEANLALAAEGKPSNIFADKKEQNGCCRVGQTKLCENNFPTFKKVANELRKQWLAQAQCVQEGRREVDFHLHMMSTIPGAEALYAGKEGDYSHQDELWFWIPSTEVAVEHLKSFLNAFRSLPQLKNMPIKAEFLGENASELKQIFEESFSPVSQISSHRQLPIAVLHFKAGAINSRKAMISPFLPHLT